MSEDTCNATKNDGEPCEYPAKYDDGKCGIHTDGKERGPGRPSKLDDHRDEILQYAKAGMSINDCAQIAGVSEPTLYNWLDDNDEFFKSFKRARARGSYALRRMLLNPDEGENPQGARFLLERSHGYTKTEDKNVDVSGSLTVDTEFVAIEDE